MVPMDTHARNVIRLCLHDASTEQASRETAIAVGRHAARLGWDEKTLADWLSRNYGALWVKETGLNPGLDFKDVRKYAQGSRLITASAIEMEEGKS